MAENVKTNKIKNVLDSINPIFLRKSSMNNNGIINKVLTLIVLIVIIDILLGSIAVSLDSFKLYPYSTISTKMFEKTNE